MFYNETGSMIERVEKAGNETWSCRFPSMKMLLVSTSIKKVEPIQILDLQKAVKMYTKNEERKKKNEWFE